MPTVERLSHYTSKSGLIGIARSQSMWATEFLALNDRVEVVYALSAIWEEALARFLQKVPDELIDRTKSEYKNSLTQYIDTTRSQINDSDCYGSIYATSFARGTTPRQNEEGVLSLWRAYNNCEGYRFQFSRSKLEQFVE